MAGIDENVAVIEDWTPSNPSPRTLFSSFLGEDFGSKSFSELLTENENEKALPDSGKQKRLVGPEVEDEGGGWFSGGHLPDSGVFEDKKPFSRGNGEGLAARMAARAGFNAPRLNTARIRSANLTSSLEVRSPYLMIPPGLSPTTLLDSPVFLSNSQAQQSPTTGTFPLALCSQRSLSVSEAPDTNKDHLFKDADDSSFAFKPHTESSSAPCFPGVGNKVVSTTNHQQSLPGIKGSVQSEHPFQARNLVVSEVHTQTQIEVQHRQEFQPQAAFANTSTRNNNTSNASSYPRAANNIISNGESNPSQSDSSITPEHSPPLEEQQNGEGDQKVELPPVAIGAPAEDGFNWRKYGQKQVKGSEYPRSYYKCTHSSCLVKKKVERSHDGHITEIIYKGAHNHPKPPPNRRSAIGSTLPPNEMPFENHENHGGPISVDGETVWESMEQGIIAGSLEWRSNGMETTPSTSAIAEFCNPSTSFQAQNGTHLESVDALEVSSALSNDEGEDDRGTHGSTSLGDDGDGDESESKRRKKDACVMDVSAASRAIREPRVVVQTTSEVDILDDGYRWRKYGQKVVKGNPNPRSYYKCTNAGCSVRKHVERASHDLKSVITTYEGKHNHDVPAARNSSHINSGPASGVPAPAAQTHIYRPEPSQIHDMARFDRLSTFGLVGGHQLGPMNGFSFTVNQPGVGNVALGGLGQNQGKLSVLPVQQYFEPGKVTENGFMMPKSELKEEPGLEPGLHVSNASVYRQDMSGLPLGHQM